VVIERVDPTFQHVGVEVVLARVDVSASGRIRTSFLGGLAILLCLGRLAIILADSLDAFVPVVFPALGAKRDTVLIPRRARRLAIPCDLLREAEELRVGEYAIERVVIAGGNGIVLVVVAARATDGQGEQ